MKRNILLLLAGVVIGGGVVWLTLRNKMAAPAGEGAAAEKPADEQPGKVSLTHDASGNVIIRMSDKTQGDAGIVVTNLAAAQWAPEVKGYGRVLDPGPLAAAFGEFTAAQAANENSQAELKRLKILTAQDNASARALQAAEAAAARDQAQFESARLKWIATGGSAFGGRPDLPQLMKSLGSLESVLVRVDLPAGQTLPSPPASARLATLDGEQITAAFAGVAAVVDPQLQSRGFLFLAQTNSSALAPGAAVAAYLQVPGAALSGVIIPRGAVVRTEGNGWVYVVNAGGGSFTRKEIALDRPTGNGWFVTSGVAAGDHVVVTGAQTLLSEELKATINPD